MNDILDYYYDLISGKTKVLPEDLAPDLETANKMSNGEIYDESEDEELHTPIKESSIYSKPDNPDTDDELDAFLSSMDINAEVEETADMMFTDMTNIVKNIILARSDKKHALIYGDPGIGKCLDGSTKIVIRTTKQIADKLAKAE